MKKLIPLLLLWSSFAFAQQLPMNGGGYVANSSTPTSGPGSGTVTNVSGTTNQIICTNPTTIPVCSIVGLAGVAGAVSVTGTSGTGSDFINAICKDGVCPVTAFAAAGVDTRFTSVGTANAGATSLILNTTYDGPNKSYIKIPAAGTNQTFAQPTLAAPIVGTEYAQVVSCTAGTATLVHVMNADAYVLDYNDGWPYQPIGSAPALNQYFNNAGTFNCAAGTHVWNVAYITTGAQTSPSAHTYQIAAADDACGYSQASATQSVSSATQALPLLDLSGHPGNGTISTGVNATAVPLPALPSGATKWLIYKDGNIVGFSQAIWLKGTPASAPVQPNYWIDNGLTYNGANSQGVQTCDPLTAPVAASPDWLVDQVTAGSGTSSVTLATPLTSGITAQTGITHDDTSAFQTACNTVIPATGGATAGEISVPAGTYRVSSTITCKPVTSGISEGLVIDGAASFAPTIAWDGGQEGNVLVSQNNGYEDISNLRFGGGPSAADIVLSTTAGGNTTQHMIAHNNFNNNYHHGLQGGLNTDTGGVSEVTVQDGSALGSIRNWGAYFLQGANETNWQFRNSGCGTQPVGNLYPMCFSNSSLNDLTGPGTVSSSNQTNWFGGSNSSNPGSGVGAPCVDCGMWAVGNGSSYNWYGFQAQGTGLFFGIFAGSANIGVNLYGVLWNAGTITGQTDAIDINNANAYVNSIGSTFITTLKFDVQSGGFTSIGDNYGTTGHATTAGYFTQAIATTPKIQVLQGGVWASQLSAPTLTGSSTSTAIAGGGALALGSNSFAGRVTGLAATANVLTPGFTCPNAITCSFEDDTTLGGVKVTAQAVGTITFSATAADTADYICACR